jgi:hypothetical protein
MQPWLRSVEPNRCTACLCRLPPFEGVGTRDRASSVEGKVEGKYQVGDGTYGPSIVRCKLVFLPPWTLSRDFPIRVLMKFDERDRVHLDRIQIRYLPNMGDTRKQVYLGHD